MTAPHSSPAAGCAPASQNDPFPFPSCCPTTFIRNESKANGANKNSGILHTIFFHRYFPTITPQTHEVLDLTLPYVAEPELETLIAQRTATLLRELDADRTQQRSSSPSLQQQARAVVGGFLGSPSSPWGGGGGGGSGGNSGANGGGRGQVSVQFMEKTRRRKMWYKGDEEVCWESWTIRVTVAEPRTENGESSPHNYTTRVTTGRNRREGL